MLIWVRAISFVMKGKRGISPLELKRELEMSSYGTPWNLLHKIREALRQRDKRYKLKNLIEFDGATFGQKATGNPSKVLIAIESKDGVDEKGRQKSKADFAKVRVAPETKEQAQAFVNQAIERNSMLHTDAAAALIDLKNVDAAHPVMGNDPIVLERWLPWVHKWISNAKPWLVGTHHGVESQYLARYLGESTFRFNRRHDPDRLFHRALTACPLAQPKTTQVLLGSACRSLRVLRLDFSLRIREQVPMFHPRT